MNFADNTQIKAIAKHIEEAFITAGIDTPTLDARLLIQHVTGLDHSGFISAINQDLTAAQHHHLQQLVARRLKREPLSRIFGKREFWSLNFSLSNEVLDPRPDTETLVELCLDMLDGRRSVPLRLLDLGTGSGCILLSLLHELHNATGVGSDLSQPALTTAQKNATQLGLTARVDFIKSHWFAKITGTFDVIVSNPPYIAQTAIDRLEPEVAVYDPRCALDGGETGLDDYQQIIDQAGEFLRPQGLLLLEFGLGQESAILDMLKVSRFYQHIEHIELKADLNQKLRCIGLKLCG